MNAAERFEPPLPVSALPVNLAAVADDVLLDIVQKQTIRYFWDGAHPVSGMALDRLKTTGTSASDLVAVGGSGFGVMAIIVAVERGWIGRAAALARLRRMVHFLERAERHHGMFPHFMHGATGATIPFRRKDDGADTVETMLLFQGLICARQYFAANEVAERDLRATIDGLLGAAEWNWFARDGDLHWHWSRKHGWAMDAPIRGWNECLLAFVLAAGSDNHPIDPDIYHHGFASGPAFCNGKDYHGVRLPLGVACGGPLFFAHYSFCGLDPRGLVDRHADYWQQNIRHTAINRLHCLANPRGHAGYGADCWGLTSCHGPRAYVACAPDHDVGLIAPTAALSSLPYAPEASMQALRGFMARPARHIWSRYGFVDSFCDNAGWYARTCLAIDQGPIVAMIENHRTGLLWNLFMAAPEVRKSLRRLGFTSPHLASSTVGAASHCVAKQ